MGPAPAQRQRHIPACCEKTAGPATAKPNLFSTLGQAVSLLYISIFSSDTCGKSPVPGANKAPQMEEVIFQGSPRGKGGVCVHTWVSAPKRCRGEKHKPVQNPRLALSRNRFISLTLSSPPRPPALAHVLEKLSFVSSHWLVHLPRRRDLPFQLCPSPSPSILFTFIGD